MARLLTFALAAAGAVTLAGCQLFGGSSGDRVRRADLAASQTTQIGVNAWLWRAALETLSFAPLAQSDSSGGVIATDWYSNPENPAERVKVTATILDADLRA